MPDEPPPFLGTWPRVYTVVLIYLAALIVLSYAFHPVLFMRPLDWVVLVGSLVFIVSYGLYKGRGSNTVNKYLLAGKTMPWYAMGLSIMATQASAVTFISTTGQAYVDGMRFVQFYFGLPIAMVILSATAVPIFHRANVYTAYEYLEKRFDAKTRALVSVIFLIQRGSGGGDLALRAGHRAVRDLRLAGPADHADHGRAGHHLHRHRRHQGGHLDRRAADADHLLRPDRGACVVIIRCCRPDVSFVDAVYLAGAVGQAQRRRPAVRLEQPLQPVERADRRHVPGAGLLRLRSIAGAALPHRKIDRAEQAEPAVQRHGQDPDAVLHPVRRRHGVRVLPVRAAAAAVPAAPPWSSCRPPQRCAQYAPIEARFDQAFEQRKAGGRSIWPKRAAPGDRARQRRVS